MGIGYGRFKKGLRMIKQGFKKGMGKEPRKTGEWRGKGLRKEGLGLRKV
jgi:hypothetical protein